ncbi:MAG: S8 family serine peptidase [Thaumarchaeota archaeon]|nr:S8 family serine peptidase [Nitrososphaerota archaeon]
MRKQSKFSRSAAWIVIVILCGLISFENTIIVASAQSNYPSSSLINLQADPGLMTEGINPKINYQLMERFKTSPDNVPILIDLKGDYTNFSPLLAQSGFEVHRAYSNLVQGRAKAADIEAIASLSFVNFVSEPVTPVFYGITSEGVNVLGANIAHSIGQTGRGAKVAIIDGGFSINNPEISTNIVEAKSFIDGVGISGDDPTHGTACAEIIVDVAPDVQLFLYAIGTNIDFVDAVNYAVSRNVDILSISLGFTNVGPTDGTSAVSKVLENARTSGVLPIVAVGNSAELHWSGTFQDLDTDNWLNINGNDETNDFPMKSGQTVRIDLSWNDWWYSDQDYDLYLFRESAGSLIEVSQSSNRQTGSWWPTEKIAYTANADGNYYIAITKFNATGDAKFDLFINGAGPLQYQVPSGSITNVADAKGAIALGAFKWSTGSLEPFSSRGPTADGRIKPDLIAPDGVLTTAYSSAFYGTSAAAPHAAGLAALLVGAMPSITADEIAALAEKIAVDLGEPGKDQIYGSGKIETKYATIDALPRSVSIVVDGKEYAPNLLPRKFLIDGKAHSVSISSTTISQTNDTRYEFKGWTNGYQSSSTNLAFDASSPTLVAQFGIQYRLTVRTSYGTPSGAGWYDSGTNAPFSVQPMFDQGNRTRRVFTSWSGSTTASNSLTSILMDGPKSVTALWKKQYELFILSSNKATSGQGWYDIGTQVSFSAQPNIDYGNGTRRAFKYWSGDFSGSETSGTILIDSPKVLEAIWRTQYLLSIDAPSEAGFKGGGWPDAGETISISGNNSWALIPHISRFNLRSFELNDQTVNVTRSSSGISIIKFEMNRPNTIRIIGVKQYFLDVQGGSNLSFGTSSPTDDRWWDDGQSVTVSTDHVWNVTEGNTRSNLISYRLDEDRYNIFRANASRYITPQIVVDGKKDLNFEAITQYLLSVTGGHETQISSSPTFDNWFDKGATVKVSSKNLWETSEKGVRELLNHWQLDNEPIREIIHSEAGRFQQDGIIMDKPHEVRFVYIIQYLLETLSQYNKPTGGGWYDKGVTATVDVPPTSEYANSTRHVFASWKGDITVDDTKTTIVMSSPKKVEAVWTTQYFMKLVSLYGNPKGQGWHDKGMQTLIQVSALEEHRNQTRHRFLGWMGNIVAEENLQNVTVDRPMLIEAKWMTQYYLGIVSPLGQPEGENWYDTGATASFKIRTPVEWGNQTRHVFVKWIGDIQSETPEGQVIMSSPHSISADWTTQYRISLIFTDSTEQQTIRPSSIKLTDKTGNHIVLEDYEQWLDRETYSIDEISWMSVDVVDSAKSTLSVSNPGKIQIQTKVYPLKIIVQDPLGQPIPDATVVTEFANKTAKMGRTDKEGVVSYQSIPLGDYSTNVEVFGLSSTLIGNASLDPEVRVTMLLSMYTIILLTATTVAFLASAIYYTKIKTKK